MEDIVVLDIKFVFKLVNYQEIHSFYAQNLKMGNCDAKMEQTI